MNDLWLDKMSSLS